MTKVIDKKKEYQWEQSWADPIAHTDIKPVIDELESISDVFGELTAERVVESAKNKSSVLHKYFQWDDAKAAHKYRISQASLLLRHIEVKVVKDGKPFFIKAFETVSRLNFNSHPTKFKRFDLITDENIKNIKKIAISDIKGIITRLSKHDWSDIIVSHLNKAIEELSKESTETKEEVKPTELKSAV